MSSKKKKEGGGMPQSSAGLMRFFQDETNGPKIRPEFVVGGAFVLIVVVLAARIFFAGLAI
ncbi:MAG: preprotein translocase subunit Sec61beta [Candidatus Bathyarchaeota archaeon]|nr:preprotein translocase subunit Sec61beta [Candidatus Bathyarchaeota archaeon]